MATARVIQDVVDDVSAYLGTITVINVTLGIIVGSALWAIGMPYPAMWGGIVALLNYIPYFGPVIAAFLMALGGLMTFPDIWVALLPSAIMVGCHLVEANVITPLRSRPSADDQPGPDPRFAELLGVGVGDGRGAACSAAADHPADGAGRRGQARHRGLPVRTRHAGATIAATAAGTARTTPKRGLTVPDRSPSSPPTLSSGCSSVG